MNIVVIEDSELIRTQLIRLISVEPRIRILGHAGEEEAAVVLVMQQMPDLVLLDLSLSPGSGFNVLCRIRAAGCAARVLVLTNNCDDALRAACVAAGASGFFDKSNEVETCLRQLFDFLPGLPANESDRLQALHESQLLDMPEMEVFDDITHLARDIAAAPMALISLIDQNRQWFLSHQGLVLRETSRSVAFCTHTILGNELMEVPDTALDPQFHDNPLVRGEPYIRYYAGVPLVLSTGEALGSLCVLDTVARHMSDRQKRALKTLAHSVVGEIELRRRLVELEQEVGRRRAAEQHILDLSTRDPLTDLPNRAALYDRLDHYLRRSHRQGTMVAFLFIDLDRFKLINDTLGHDVGDSALMETADRLRQALRESDTVARLGGDEFAVVLPEIRSAVEAMEVAQKLIRTLNAPATLRGHRVHLDASIGVAIYPEQAATFDELIRHADLAMYQAKQTGSGRANLFTRELTHKAGDQLALENDLRDAIDNGELVAYFQPHVNLQHGGICGVEALVRWRHPQLGILSPDQFIPFSEARGFIHQIGKRMVNLALDQILDWDAQGIYVPRIAVNVSAIELKVGYADMVEAALARSGVAANRLELEITESALARDSLGVLAILNTLRRRGVSISVDDFGVGYSSLGQLRRLPIDTLKIDRSFVAEIDKNEPDIAIVRAVVTMAQSLGLRTIAEGAEELRHVQVLRRLGCDCVQGYVVARPLPPEAFSQWARTFAGFGDG